MAPEVDPLDLLGLEPDERLLGEDLRQLPASVGEPPAELPESPARRRIVRTGAIMTGATFIGGLAVGLLGLIEVISSGGVAWIVVLVLGIVLASTHWGWVHVAELTGNRIEASRTDGWQEARRQWLRGVEPYPRWEVSTSVGEDGEITIVTVCHRPVTREGGERGEGKYTFMREEVGREVHAAEETAATVSERAELLRRQAAEDTEQARDRYETARAAYEYALLARDDEEQRRAALRAASEALSERINANLRDPPLVE